jgi:phosphoglycerol transferase MdoB-like AlkP superfamily enzyme
MRLPIGPRFKASLVMLVLLAVGFQLARLIFYILYYDSYFYELSPAQVVTAFVHGALFDASAYLTFAGLPLILMNVQIPGRAGLLWFKTWFWVTFAVMTVAAVFLLGDILYFPYVKRHVYDELLLLGSDIGAIFATVWDAFLWQFVAGGLLIAGLGWITARRMQQAIATERGAWARCLSMLLVFAAVIRGGFSMKPLNIIDAYSSGSSVQGDLVLNGVFTAWHVSRKGSVPPPRFFSDDEAVSHLRSCGLDWSGPYPFQQSAHGASEGDYPNVVVVLLESFFNPYVGSFGGRVPGLTPEFDAIAAKGMRFTNFFANGQRSIEAIQAILTGVPAMRGIPDLGGGFEMVRTGSLARYARRSGYETLFVQSSARRSFRLDSAAAALGFEHYFGREDYQLRLDYDPKLEALFGYDYEMLQLMVEELGRLRQPFLGFGFTGTSHTPFILPPSPFRAEGHGPENETGFINTVHYTDWSVGEFFRAARRQDWFANTIFVLTADHTFPRFGEFDLVGRFKVPLVIVRGRDLLSDQETGHDLAVYGSHVDLMPTIADLAGWQGDIAAVGTSLLRPAADRCVWLSGRFGNPAVVTPRAQMVHTLEQRLEASASAECGADCLMDLERALLSFHQILQSRYRQNQVVAPESLPANR